MKQTRKKHGAAFKAKMALAAIRGGRANGRRAGEHIWGHPSQIYAWTKQLLYGAAGVFGGGGPASDDATIAA